MDCEEYQNITSTRVGPTSFYFQCFLWISDLKCIVYVRLSQVLIVYVHELFIWELFVDIDIQSLSYHKNL